jgi:serine/threonine protein kinase
MVYTPIYKPLRQIIEDIGRNIEVPIGATETTESEGTAPDVASTVAVKSVVEEWTPIPTNPAETECFHDLLSRMLQIDPAKRTTIEEVSRHSWFNTDFGIKTAEDEIKAVEETMTAEEIKAAGETMRQRLLGMGPRSAELRPRFGLSDETLYYT